MARWLVKTEPSTYSYQQLQKDKRTVWDGIKNPLALKNLAAVHKGDTIIVYHTGDEKAVVGLATAVSEPYPDPKESDPRLLVIDVKADKALATPISLAAIKSNPRLEKFPLVRISRLSVMPVSDEEWREIQASA